MLDKNPLNCTPMQNAAVTYQTLCNEYQEVSALYNAMPDTLRTSAGALKLIGRMKAINKELSTIDATIGKYSGRGGNYVSKLDRL